MAEATFFRGSAASAATADPLVLDWPEEISPVPTLVPPAPIPAEGPLRKLTRSARLFYHWKIRKSVVLPYRPTEVGIELTNRCNFKCSFCPQSDPQHFDRVAPSAIVPGRARTLLKKLRDGGVDTRIIHWTLDGEPFMNKRFADVVKEAVTLGFDTHHFATNAYLLTLDRMYEFPAEGQRYHLTPDFCSEREYFETYRGTPGSWERVLENLRAALKDPGLAHFHFKVTDISSYTIRDEAELVERFEALKALFPESDRISFHRRTYHNATGFSAMEENKDEGKYHLCPYPWYSFMIASNGDVVSCCRDLEHKTVLGNLFEQEFEDIWNGEKYQALRRDLIDGKPEKQSACTGCDMPYDSAKFSMAHLARTAVHRMLLFEKSTN